MVLYTPPAEGDFDPYFKYNAKAGRFYFKGPDGEVEVSNPVFVADFSNVKKAWMHYQEGQAPDIVYFPDINTSVEKPSDSHKLGLEVRVYSDKLFGGAAVFSSNSINTCKGLNEVYEEYEAGSAKNQGKVPVIKFVEAKPIKGSYGTNYEPVFKIEKWIDRPEALDAGGAPSEPTPSNAASEESSDEVSEF